MVRSACATMFVLTAVPALAQDGAALYGQYCAVCHDGGVVRAPARRALGEMTPERLVASLETGLMRAQGSALNDDQQRAIAVFLSGKPLGSMTAPVTAPRCTRAPAAFSNARPSAWDSWSAGFTNDRYQPRPGAGLTAADVPKLKVKWTFGFAGDTSAAIQPTIVDGRVFVGSSSGRVYALSLSDGCAYWTFDADAQVRTATTVGRERGAAPPSGFFADVAPNISSLDAATGQLRWKKRGDDHPVKLSDRKSTRLNSSHVRISYAVFCLKKKKHVNKNIPIF